MDQADSFMYQTVGHSLIDLYSDCLGLPMYRQSLTGGSVNTNADYSITLNDEVEDLFTLLSRVKADFPDLQAVASGAILSNYQRVRVEHVCQRLGLVSLAFLWEREQDMLLKSMVDFDLNAVLIKVACMGMSISL
jgi:diphthine-ammonia ligase